MSELRELYEWALKAQGGDEYSALLWFLRHAANGERTYLFTGKELAQEIGVPHGRLKVALRALEADEWICVLRRQGLIIGVEVLDRLRGVMFIYRGPNREAP